MTDRDSSFKKHIPRHWPDVQISASHFHAPICQILEIPCDSDIPMRERGRVWGGGGHKSAAFHGGSLDIFWNYTMRAV